MTSLLVRLFVKNAREVTNPAVRAAYGRMAGIVGILCNLLLAGAKLLVGFFSGSIAITADAVNNFSDASSSVVTLVGFKMAAKPADKEHPFGHARIEYIAGLAVAVMVLVIGIELAKTSIGKIITPTPVDFSIWSFIVLALSIAVKMWMALFNRTIGRRIDSTALEATFADSRNDVITTSALLVAAVVGKSTGWEIDGWMGAAVAAFIIYSGAGLVKSTLDPLLGEAPDPKLVQHIADKIIQYDGVLGTHDLIVHDYGPGRRFASAHVEMASNEDVIKSHETIDEIERYFLEEENIHLIIHYDPIEIGDSKVETARNWTLQQIKTIDDRLTLHDFRMVDGKRHVNYIFDVVVPVDFEMTHQQLQEEIQKRVQNGSKKISTVVTVDDSYAAIPKLE